MFDKISLPFFIIDTDVSSQLDSIPHCYYIFVHFLLRSPFNYLIINLPKLNIPVATQLITGDIISPANPVTHNKTNIM